jgi:hypothetical protein
MDFEYRPTKKLRTKNVSKGVIKEVESEDEREYDSTYRDLKKMFPFKDEVPVIKDSRIEFFKNGVSQGRAFVELPVPIAVAALVHPSARKPKEAFMPVPPTIDDGSLGYTPSTTYLFTEQILPHNLRIQRWIM